MITDLHVVIQVMFDGEPFCRRGHSAGCVTLSDGTVVVSIFGGNTTPLSSSIVSTPCFYQWSKLEIIVFKIIVGLCLLCSDPHHPTVLRSGVAPAGAVVHAHPCVSASSPSPADSTIEEVISHAWVEIYIYIIF